MPLLFRPLVAVLLLGAPQGAAAWEAGEPGPIRTAAAEDGWTRLQPIAARLVGLDQVAEEGNAVSFSRFVGRLDATPGGDGALSPSLSEQQPFAAIRARIGYAFDRFVAYGTAGAAFAPASFVRSEARAQAGWALGVGLEADLFAGVAARAEYLYVDLDRSATAAGDVSFAPGGQFRAGLNYRF